MLAPYQVVSNRRIDRMINLTTLAPEIQAAILDETLPETVSLFDLASDTPLSMKKPKAWESNAVRANWQSYDCNAALCRALHNAAYA